MSYKKYFITFANEKFAGALKRIERQVKSLNIFESYGIKLYLYISYYFYIILFKLYLLYII